MHFQTPIMLFSLALVPLLVLAYFLTQRRRRTYAVRFTNLSLLEQVAGKGPGARRHIPPALYMFGAMALLVGLARPEAMLRVPRNQAAVVIAIDVSASMTAKDLQPSRLEAAKKAAKAFIDSLPDTVQVGLVSFSGTTGVVSPLTLNHSIVKVGIDLLQTSGGTAVGEAIYQALALLDARPGSKKNQAAPAIIILLTDGQSNAGRSPMTAAQSARDQGIPIYTIGIGERGSQPTIVTGASVGLDEPTLRSIASTTGGSYYYAAQSGKLTQIYKALGARIAWVKERTEITTWVEGFGTLLFILGGLLSLHWFQHIP